MSNDLQATNLLPFNIRPEREGMEDEAHENAPVRAPQGSPESPSLNNNNNSSGSNSNNNNNNGINKEQDRFLPIANVGRIMKKVIPANGKISKEAKETVQECVSEFISFVTGEASEKCQREKRKTINGDDIIWALATLNFEDYVNPLKLYLNKYKEVEGEKLNNPKQQQQPQQNQRPRSLASDQQQLQQRMHHHHLLLQQPDQMGLLGPNTGGFGPFSSPASVYSSPSPLTQQSPFVGADQPFNLPFSPSNSLQKPYHQHPEQIDSIAHW